MLADVLDQFRRQSLLWGDVKVSVWPWLDSNAPGAKVGQQRRRVHSSSPSWSIELSRSTPTSGCSSVTTSQPLSSLDDPAFSDRNTRSACDVSKSSLFPRGR